MDGVITNIARAKTIQARAGDIELAPVSHMAFGDGGTDAEGNPVTPLPTDTALENELMRKSVTGHTYPSANTCRYSCSLMPGELTGQTITEIALYDNDDDMIYRKTFPAKVKAADLEMIFEIDDVF